MFRSSKKKKEEETNVANSYRKFKKSHCAVAMINVKTMLPIKNQSYFINFYFTAFKGNSHKITYDQKQILINLNFVL